MINLRRPTQKAEVMFLNPDDHRYVDIPVEKESEEIVYCKKWQGILYRFFKLGPGWNGKKIRFLAVEGHPLISYVTDKDEDGKELQATVTGTLEEFLTHIFTEKGYKGLPELLKERVRNPPVGTTINIKPYIPTKEMQKKFDEVKAASVLYDADLNSLVDLGTAKEVKNWVDKTMDRIPWILAGFGLTYVLMGLGVLKGF